MAHLAVRLAVVVLVASAAVGVGTKPATADHDPWATSCQYDPATRTVSLHIATTHVVSIDRYEGGINYTDLTNFQNKGPCGPATVKNTDTIDVTEETPGESRLQLNLRFGRLAPGFTSESDGHSEIELNLGSLTDIWILGRDVAENFTIGGGGITLTPDADADVIGSNLAEISVFCEGGDDYVSARGGRGTGTAWTPPLRGYLVAYGADGEDRMYGSSGRDILDGDSGVDRISGGAGNDDLDGGSHDDEIYGGSGKDYISGGSWSDTIYGGAGSDFIEAHDETADHVDGGNGTDGADVDTQDTTTSVELLR